MPAGRYKVMDGDGGALGTESFRCAPGPIGWRYVSDIETTDPTPHAEHVDLSVDAAWRPVRAGIDTGSHAIALVADGPERLDATLDGRRIDVPWDGQMHLDYLSPAFNAVTSRRLLGTGEIRVLYLEPFTCEPVLERQRYDSLGEGEVETPVGRFRAHRWRFTALSTGWSRELWIASDLVVAFDGLFELEWYEAGASGPRAMS
jgi:hypothetical protein